MSTVVNNSRAVIGENEDNSQSLLLGSFLLIAAAILFLAFGLTYLHNVMTQATPEISIPGKVDINVQPQGK